MLYIYRVKIKKISIISIKKFNISKKIDDFFLNKLLIFRKSCNFHHCHCKLINVQISIYFCCSSKKNCLQFFYF